MHKTLFAGVGVMMVMVAQGCIELPDTSQLLPVGTPFVVRGTMTLAQNGGACLVWQAENGVSYYLYQDALLDNDTFDRVTTPGVTSRLAISTRSDLPAPCSVGRVVEVRQVLEIVE